MVHLPNHLFLDDSVSTGNRPFKGVYLISYRRIWPYRDRCQVGRWVKLVLDYTICGRKNEKTSKRTGNQTRFLLLIGQRALLCCSDDPNLLRRWCGLASHHIGNGLYIARFYGTILNSYSETVTKWTYPGSVWTYHQTLDATLQQGNTIYSLVPSQWSNPPSGGHCFVLLDSRVCNRALNARKQQVAATGTTAQKKTLKPQKKYKGFPTRRFEIHFLEQ